MEETLGNVLDCSHEGEMRSQMTEPGNRIHLVTEAGGGKGEQRELEM